MGRYLLIEFDDKEPAVKLMKQINEATRRGKRFRVVGYFASPDGPYCQCPLDHWTHEKAKPYAPSKFIHKYGWVKCLQCKLYRDSPYSLKNLLGVEKLINPRVRQVSTGKSEKLIHYFLLLGSISHRLVTKNNNE